MTQRTLREDHTDGVKNFSRRCRFSMRSLCALNLNLNDPSASRTSGIMHSRHNLKFLEYFLEKKFHLWRCQKVNLTLQKFLFDNRENLNQFLQIFHSKFKKMPSSCERHKK
jgi:hypothetical protein